MLPWKLRKRHILPVNQNLSSVYFSLAKFQFVSCNLSIAMMWQITYTHKLPKLCSATLHLGTGKKKVFGVEMTEVRDAELSCKRSRTAGSGSPIPADPDRLVRRLSKDTIICTQGEYVDHSGMGPVARSLVSANRWLRGIKMYRFPWYLTLVSTNHASSDPGLINSVNQCIPTK